MFLPQAAQVFQHFLFNLAAFRNLAELSRVPSERNFDVSWVTNQNDFHHNQATTVLSLWISLPGAQSLLGR
jgi:hypothetical protein